jgi:prepilin-type N-terminal cleavage/methylation domain-containing protein
MVSHKGMTLIEVMIALVITTVGLLGALAMIGSLYTGTVYNRSVTEALALAQSKIEQINSLPVTLASPADGTVESELLDGLGNVASSLTQVAFTRKTTWGSNLAQQTRRVTVDVTWLDGGGRPHQVSMQGERIP